MRWFLSALLAMVVALGLSTAGASADIRVPPTKPDNVAPEKPTTPPDTPKVPPAPAPPAPVPPPTPTDSLGLVVGGALMALALAVLGIKLAKSRSAARHAKV